MDVEKRIARLERNNRVMRIFIACAVATVFAMGLSPEKERELTLDRLVIGQREGVPRMVIEQNDERVMLAIEHPHDEDVPLLHIGSGPNGAWMNVGNSGWLALSKRQDHRFTIGGWGFDASTLKWGSPNAPVIELGVRDIGAYANFADRSGLERVAVEIFEPWDKPGETAGSLIINSHKETSRVTAESDD